MVDSGDSGGRRSSVGARQAPLRPPPPLRCGSPAADPAWRRPLAGSARPSSGRARANLRRLVHHPRPARVALPARAASTSCSTAVAPRRRWRGSSPFSKAELVLPRSARGRQARARASRRLLELRGTRPPSTPLHPLVPPLHSQVCARPDCRGSGRILKDWLPLPRPPRRPPGVWLTTRKNWPLGCSGSPGPRVRPGRLPPALCVRAAKLSEETPCGYAARGGMIKGTIGGSKETVLTGGRPGQAAAPRLPSGLVQNHPRPRLPRPSRVRASRAGEERGHRDAPAAVLPELLGRGSGLFGVLLSRFGRGTERVEGK